MCIVAGVLCAILGLIIGAPTLRLRGDYLALVTLGFGEVITQFFRNSGDIAGFNLANGDPGISPIDPIGTGPLGAAGDRAAAADQLGGGQRLEDPRARPAGRHLHLRLAAHP